MHKSSNKFQCCQLVSHATRWNWEMLHDQQLMSASQWWTEEQLLKIHCSDSTVSYLSSQICIYHYSWTQDDVNLVVIRMTSYEVRIKWNAKRSGCRSARCTTSILLYFLSGLRELKTPVRHMQWYILIQQLHFCLPKTSNSAISLRPIKHIITWDYQLQQYHRYILF